MRYLMSIALMVVSIVCVGTAQAEKRIALLIGNSAYAESIGALDNPANDLVLVKSTLLSAGFKAEDITVIKDADRRSMLLALDAFAAKAGALSGNDVAMFYYSGHGAKQPGQTGLHLIPVDATNVADMSFWYDTVSFNQRVVSKLEDTGTNAALIVSIDACRNELNLPTRSLGNGDKGFGIIPSSSGMLISFAADDNQTARDYVENGGVRSKNSPYALAMAEELLKPGRSISTAFGAIRPNVMQKTSRVQQPVLTNKLNRDPVLVASVNPGPGPGPTVDQDDRDWARLSGIGRYGLETYLQLHPQGKHATAAKAEIERLKSEEQPSPKPTPEPKVTPVPTPTPTPTPEPDSQHSVSVTALGLTVRDLTDADRQALNLKPTDKGVFLQAVAAGSEADRKYKLKPGVAITKVSFKAVGSVGEFKAAIATLRSNGRPNAMIGMRAKSGSQIVSLSMD